MAASSDRVIDARDRYLRANGLSAAHYAAPWFAIGLGRWSLWLPNPRQRRATVGRHDLHHVATGFGSSVLDELLVSAWEVGAGLGGLWVAWVLCVPAFLAGLLIAPRRAVRSFVLGRRCRSLFGDDAADDVLLGLTVGELRRRLGLPEEGAGRLV